MNKQSTDIATQPVIDVAIITYNHQDYLDTCLERVIQQQLDGHFRVSIYDDCSTDGTENIARKWLGEYPQIIRYFRHPKNLGIAANWRFAIEHSTAPYLAICEGDDYWTDVRKLQQQLNFLEINPEYSLCFHDFESVDRQADVKPVNPSEFVDVKSISLEDLADGNIMMTLTVMLRRESIPVLPSWYESRFIHDYALFILAAKSGKIAYLSTKMAVYRANDGAWTGLHINEKYLRWAQGLYDLQVEFADMPLIRARILWSFMRHHSLLVASNDNRADQLRMAIEPAISAVYPHVMEQYHDLTLSKRRPSSIRQLLTDLKGRFSEKISYHKKTPGRKAS